MIPCSSSTTALIGCASLSLCSVFRTSRWRSPSRMAWYASLHLSLSLFCILSAKLIMTSPFDTTGDVSRLAHHNHVAIQRRIPIRHRFPATSYDQRSRRMARLAGCFSVPCCRCAYRMLFIARSCGETDGRMIPRVETEKYAHVTFFFNGGVEKQFPLEDRLMIPSPKVR